MNKSGKPYVLQTPIASWYNSLINLSPPWKVDGNTTRCLDDRDAQFPLLDASWRLMEFSAHSFVWLQRMKLNLWDSIIVHASTINCWNKFPDRVIILHSSSWSIILKANHSRIVNVFIGLWLVDGLEWFSLWLILVRYPSSPYENNNGYCNGK